MNKSAAEISIVVLEPDERAAASLQDALSRDHDIRTQATVTEFADLIEEIARQHPDVIVADLSALGDPSEGVRAALSRAPDACVVITGAEASPGAVSRAVSAGARGFVLKPFQPDELVTTVREAHANLWTLRGLQQNAHQNGHKAAGVRNGGTRGLVVAVYGPKGGVGCTTIATSLAVALAAAKGANGRERVALVDLDLQFGDVGVALDLHGANSIEDLASHDGEIDAALINDVLVRHSSGVRALLAPESVFFADDLDVPRIVSTVEQLRSHFDYTVCDLWSSFDELTLATLRAADRTVLVTTPELPALRNLGRVIGSAPPALLERAIIVVNRHPGKAGVSLAEIQKSLGRAVAATIPSDGIGVTQAINQGISLFDSRARVRSGRSYLRLARAITQGLDELPAPVLERTGTAS
jgi:pilus assembly protein CpaE